MRWFHQQLSSVKNSGRYGNHRGHSLFSYAGEGLIMCLLFLHNVHPVCFKKPAAVQPTYFYCFGLLAWKVRSAF